VDVVAKVSLDDVHDMVVPFCKNIKLVCDLQLWGFDLYPTLVYPII